MSRSSVNATATPPQDNFRVAAKTRLLEMGLTVTDLARRIGKARSTVSMAINHPVHPTVRRRVAKALGMASAPKS